MSESMSAADALTALAGAPVDLDHLEFCVITGPGEMPTRSGGSRDSYWPFERGEILLVDKFTGREPFGEGRKPSKWSVETEYVATLAEAQSIRERVLSEPDDR